MALFTWPSRCSLSKTSLLGCQGDFWVTGKGSLMVCSQGRHSFFSLQFYGPRIGALYVRGPGTTTPLHPMLFGGGQERNFRPG